MYRCRVCFKWFGWTYTYPEIWRHMDKHRAERRAKEQAK